MDADGSPVYVWAMGPTVILRRCESYDPDRIRGIVREGMQALGDLPKGKVLIKPNGVIAHPELFPHAFTRAEFLDGVLGATRDVSPELSELAVGERCGITMPTRMSFTGAGWHAPIAKHNARAYYFDEVPQVEVALKRTPRLRDYFYTPEPVAKCDYLINCPKFKAHPWTTVTFALKNFIGIQQDEHRLIDHDQRLDDKIADLQEIVQQRFIAIDAIVAGQDRMLTPTPFDLGLVIMGNNPVAVDTVSCALIGVDPRSVGHIVAAHKKGFGPIELSEIRLDGDVTLEEGQKKAKGFRVGRIRVEKYFEGSRITAYAGPPPDEVKHEYCWGGCPGAIEEAIEIVRQIDTKADEKMSKMTVVFGGYQGPIAAGPKEKVVFIGDCARWKGEIAGKPVEIESKYLEHSHRDPHHARSSGIFAKIAQVYWKLFRASSKQVIRLEGCPVSVAEHTLVLAALGGTKNPYFAPVSAIPFMRAWLVSKTVRLFKRLFGMPDKKPALPNSA